MEGLGIWHLAGCLVPESLYLVQINDRGDDNHLEFSQFLSSRQAG